MAAQAIQSRATGEQSFVSGSLELDGPQLVEALYRSGRAEVASGIERELARTVGFGDVDDPTQLMARETYEGVAALAPAA